MTDQERMEVEKKFHEKWKMQQEIEMLREESRLTHRMLEIVRKRNKEADRVIAENSSNLELSRINMHKLRKMDEECENEIEKIMVDIKNLKRRYQEEGGVEDE